MLKAEFEMKDLEAAKKILGIKIQRDRKKGLLRLSQSSYIEKVLQRFGINPKLVIIPLTQYCKLFRGDSAKTEKEKADMVRVPYASAVGSIIYLMICTRLYLARSVNIVNQYMSALKKEH